MSGEIFLKVLSIVALDLILSGDNSVVIALATRKLVGSQRNKAIFIGTGGAVVLRIVLMFIAVHLLAIPFVKIIGSLLLFYIAFDLLKSNEEETDVKSNPSFFAAVRTIILADLVMSLDNVLAVAGVADGHVGLAAFGIIISIPIVVFFSQIIIKLMDRFPILIWVGALLIAYTAGEMLVEDQHVAKIVNAVVPHISHTHWIPIVFCLLLFSMNFILNKPSKTHVY